MTKNQFGCYYFGAYYDLNLNRNRPVICQMFCDLSSVFLSLSLSFSTFLVVPERISIKTLLVCSTVFFVQNHRHYCSVLNIYIWIFSDDNHHFFWGHYANKSILRVKHAAKRRPTDEIFRRIYNYVCV